MKKSFFAVLALAILATPLVVLGIISVMRVQPEAHKPIADLPMADAARPLVLEEKQVPPTVGVPTPPKAPSATYMNGYWDGWHGVWLGPIRWTLSDDYRQGHMLGTYDRRHGIKDRYPRPQ